MAHVMTCISSTTFCDVCICCAHARTSPTSPPQTGFLVLSAFVLVSIAVPVILPVFVPLAAAFVWLRARYLRASREVKRWEAVTRCVGCAGVCRGVHGIWDFQDF